MLLPFETHFTISFVASPWYDWEPVPTPQVPAPTPSDLPDPGISPDTPPLANWDASVAPPQMRLVLKGIAWTVHQARWEAINPAWQAQMDDARQQDADRSSARAREARRLPGVPWKPVADAGYDTSAPSAAGAASSNEARVMSEDTAGCHGAGTQR